MQHQRRPEPARIDHKTWPQPGVGIQNVCFWKCASLHLQTATSWKAGSAGRRATHCLPACPVSRRAAGWRGGTAPGLAGSGGPGSPSPPTRTTPRPGPPPPCTPPGPHSHTAAQVRTTSRAAAPARQPRNVAYRRVLQRRCLSDSGALEVTCLSRSTVTKWYPTSTSPTALKRLAKHRISLCGSQRTCGLPRIIH